MISTNSHHIMFKLEVDGVATVLIRMSKNMQEIDDHLASLMAKQCKLSKQEFWNLIDCSLSGEDWKDLVRERS